VVWVTLSLGSNTRPYENFGSGLDMLLLQFQDLALSSVYESVGDQQPKTPYLNMAVGFDSDLPLPALATLLKKIEDKHGRARTPALSTDVTLDLDLLTYGDKAGTFTGVSNAIVLPHPDILAKAYVLTPLAQIAGKKRHSVLKKTFSVLSAELVPQFTQAGQHLQPVTFDWHGRVLSKSK
jgi:2-amino-4-hydroxy-6-hydroxymethyldihydropteridine diphosphokinase